MRNSHKKIPDAIMQSKITNRSLNNEASERSIPNLLCNNTIAIDHRKYHETHNAALWKSPMRSYKGKCAMR